jgi:hypothetical protein
MAFYRFGSKNLGDTAKVQPDGSGLYSILTGVAGQPDVVWVTVRHPNLPDASLTSWPRQSVVSSTGHLDVLIVPEPPITLTSLA